MTTLTREILRNPEGVTLNRQGEKVILKGFAVSITNNKSSLRSGDMKRALAKVLSTLDILGEQAYIGSWISPEKEVFIDVSLNIPTLDEARALAKRFKQQAIYNFDTEEVITLQ